MKTLRIAHLYSKLLNIYGDGGNILTLKKRCEWRNIPVEIEEINIGDKIKEHDLYFIGGGQDMQQIEVANELQKQFFKRFYLKQMTLKATIGKDDNSFLVAICSGGIQMLMGAIIAFIKTEKPTSNLSFTVYPMYHKNSIAFSFNTRFSISITNLILCFFSAKYITNKKKRRKENGKKLQTSN